MGVGNSVDKENLVRIGMVNYINTSPIYEVWKRNVKNERYLVVEEPPSVLNRMLALGKIDLGFVSSYEYCARPKQYKILRDLSISATGAVGSVFLFSDLPLSDLGGKLILLSNQSETSVSLVKIILEEFNSLTPQYITGDVMGEMRKSCRAVLAIGDDALRLVSDKTYAYQFDLGEIWYHHTGLPFVFSVCAAQESFCNFSPETATAITAELIACRRQGRRELRQICQSVAPRIPMDFERCYSYLQALEFDLDHRKCRALEQFYSLLIQRGEASPEALPLKLFPNTQD